MKLFRFAPILAAVSLAQVASSHAQLNLDLVFSSGAVPPAAPGPWAIANFSDLGPNSVLFTLSTTANLTPPESIKSFYFNFDDTLNVSPATLNFSLSSTVGTFDLPSIGQSINNYKADGDGKYDVLLSFTQGDPAATAFGQSESISYVLTYSGVGTMTATSFQFLSQPAGGEGPFYAAAHVQSTPAGGGGSAWIAANAVPEPTTLSLLAMGVALILRKRRN